MIIKEKRYIKKCDCGTEIIYTRRDCYHNTTWDIYSLYCPSCSHEYSYRRGTHHDLFDKEYEEDSVDKDEEIERLNKELETLKQPQVFIDTQDMEERYGEDLYKEYLEKENKRLNNIINKKEQFLGDNIKRLEREVVKRDNIIKRFEEDLREVYLTFGEFSEEYTEKKIRELKGEDKK